MLAKVTAIKVYSAPSPYYESQSTVQILRSSDGGFTLECSISARGTPYVTWQKTFSGNTETLQSSYASQKSYDKYSWYSQLSMTAIRKNLGTYICSTSYSSYSSEPSRSITVQFFCITPKLDFYFQPSFHSTLSQFL